MSPKTPFLICFYMLSVVAVYAQDPDIEANEQRILEELFRTSDADPSRATSSRVRDGMRKRVSAPLGGVRVGCVCMDDTRSDSHSSGACSGKGGVRYWLYRKPEGDTVKVLTLRHERHPHPLDSIERSEINTPKVKLPKGAAALSAVAPVIQPVIIQPAMAAPVAQAIDEGWFDWSDAAAISGGGVSLYFTLRMLLRWIDSHQALIRYVLRHLLRFGKRPEPRKGRKNTTPPRV